MFHSPQNLSQYVAITTEISAEDIPVFAPPVNCGIIQFWSSNLQSETKAEKPILEFCISHNFGSISCLHWCPSGIYESSLLDSVSSSSREENASTYKEMNSEISLHVPRLGAVAAACSSGDIQIWILPHPQFLPPTGTQPRVFQKSPDITLSQFDDNEKLVPCKIDWLPFKGHGRVAATMNDGTVVIWDLEQTAMTSDCEDERVVYPVNSIQCHLGPASAVAWCPQTNGCHLATGGHDRMHHLWDTENLPTRLSSIRREVVTDTCWPTNTTSTVQSFDDVYFMDQSTTALRDCGYFPGNIIYCRSNSTTWNVSLSNSLGAVAQATDNGECSVTIFRDFYKLLSDKSKKNFRFNFKVETQKLQLKDDRKHEDSDDNLGLLFYNTSMFLDAVAPVKEDPSAPPPESGDGIKYPDTVSFANDMLVDGQKSAACRENLTSNGITAATTVAFNPNISYHDCLLVGYKSGLARILRLPPLTKRRCPAGVKL